MSAREVRGEGRQEDAEDTRPGAHWSHAESSAASMRSGRNLIASWSVLPTTRAQLSVFSRKNLAITHQVCLTLSLPVPCPCFRCHCNPGPRTVVRVSFMNSHEAHAALDSDRVSCLVRRDNSGSAASLGDRENSGRQL